MNRNTFFRIAPALAMAALVLTACGGATPANTSLIDRNDTVKHASMDISGANPDSVREKIYANIDKFEAKVVGENWQDYRNVKFNGSLTIELPSARFLEMINWIKENLPVQSMSVYAREVREGDAQNGTVVNGVVYSNIYLSIHREAGFAESFAIGLQNGGDALRFSLQSIVPVVSFILPYAILLFSVIYAIKLTKFSLRKLAHRKNSQTNP